MPRVLYVATSTTIGGAEKTLYRIASSVDRRRIEVAGVVSLKSRGYYADRLEEAGIRVETLDMETLPSFGDLFRLRELIRLHKPDIVHAFLYRASQFCRMLKALGEPFKLISSPRVVYRTRPAVLLWLDRQLKGYDDLLISESVASQRFFVREQGYSPARITVIHNGVEPSEFVSPHGTREAARREFGFAPEDVVAGVVGRLDDQKGQAVFLKALAMSPPAVKGLLVGEGPDRGKLEEQVRMLGLEGRCLFLGERKDIARCLAAMDLFVLSSYWEGVPNAVLEALSASLPVAASAVDGVMEVVEDGVTGLLFPAGDPQALAERMRRLVGDAGLRGRLAQEGRRRIADHFTLARMMRGYEDAYKRVAGHA